MAKGREFTSYNRGSSKFPPLSRRFARIFLAGNGLWQAARATLLLSPAGFVKASVDLYFNAGAAAHIAASATARPGCPIRSRRAASPGA
jgi:hypothetical protein